MDTQNTPRSFVNKELIIGVAIGSLFLAVGHVFAAGVTEQPSDKLLRLESNYEAQVQIIEQAEAVIEKQHDIKAKATQTLHSLVVELANIKIGLEMSKEEPDMAEVDRLNKKMAEHLSLHGSSVGKALAPTEG